MRQDPAAGDAQRHRECLEIVAGQRLRGRVALDFSRRGKLPTMRRSMRSGAVTMSIILTELSRVSALGHMLDE